MRLIVDGEKDCKAGYGSADGDYREDESMFGLIGQECDYHGKDKCTCPWWNAVQLSADWGVSITGQVKMVLFKSK